MATNAPLEELQKTGDGLALPEELQKTGDGLALAPEIVEALKGEGAAQININILLRHVIERAESPERLQQQVQALIALHAEFEAQRLKAFKARTQAIIDAKSRDPDEIEKRSNNLVRRQLKRAIAVCAIGGNLGALFSVASGGPIVLTGSLAVVGVVCIAMLGPLASGESISSNDVVRMVTALGNVVGKNRTPGSGSS